MKQIQDSYLSAGNVRFIEEQLEFYLQDPSSVSEEWQNYFTGMLRTDGLASLNAENKNKNVVNNVNENNVLNDNVNGANCTNYSYSNNTRSDNNYCQNLITNFRLYGHYYADLDPLGIKKSGSSFIDNDNDRGNRGIIGQEIIAQEADLSSEIGQKYKNIYCNTVGFECSYIDNIAERQWLENFIEDEYPSFNLSPNEEKRILQKLVEAEGLEQFLHNKFVGQKRFSLEGCDSFIPMLDFLLNYASQNEVSDVVMGMAHRGRLNTLVNIIGKAPQDVFDEFEGTYKISNNGDVKYHKGGSAIYQTSTDGKIKVHLLNNPSHLEAVNPVTQGVVRAMQDSLAHNNSLMEKDILIHKDQKDPLKQKSSAQKKSAILPVLIHGDSAFIGLGVNQGCFNMSQTNGYGVKGSIHIVINNQVGFTNSNLEDNRSGCYCTDIAKMVQAPIMHVNADDLRSIVFVTKLALEYRQKFEKDIVIDLIGYRKYGHNEGDDPSLTQPFMYAKIKQHSGIRSIFADSLLQKKVISQQENDAMLSAYLENLKLGKHVNASQMVKIPTFMSVGVARASKLPSFNAELLKKLHDKISNLNLAEDFVLHPTIVKLLQTRQAMMAGQQEVNLALAETLAYALIIHDGKSIRLSGEDSGRGTFSHRNAVLYNYKSTNQTVNSIIPLKLLEQQNQNLLDQQNEPNDQSEQENSCSNSFSIYDSVLNEEAVLSFEYGYSLQASNDLVIWEAQFGDFANGAQVAIDQFITSAEAKWNDKSRLLMLLPHGLDGQGPEHSSARIERFLQLAAQDNIVLLYPTTASQMFYLLLEQVYNSTRIKPVVVFLSKRLLRSKEAAININQLIEQKSFAKVIDDNSVDKKKIKKILCCTGQFYYDLMKMKQDNKYDTIAIVRLEQIYPFPLKELKDIIAGYSNAKEFLWVQEEHYNQGAWSGVRDYLSQCATFECISRLPSATTACGSIQISNAQLKDLLEKVFK